MTTAARRDVVLRFDDVEARDPSVAGGKAAALAELVTLGVPVPAGVVLSTETCATLVGGTVPEHLRRRLGDVLDELGGPLAVRSSAVAEDLRAASFAGLYETVLDVVDLDGLCAAVVTVVDSARAGRVQTYQEHAHAAPGMAVLIQRQLAPTAAGVAFSANPVTGARDETLVSAVEGLGDRLVSGEASPDEYVVRGDAIEVVARPEQAITDEQVREIARLAERLERLRGRPQDIEWALDADGIHVLQSRPITALPVEPEMGLPDGTWTKDAAHYPEPLTPLGESVYTDDLDEGVRTMAAEWGLMVETVEQRTVGGEVYTHAVPFGGKEGGPTPPWWVLAIVARLVPSIRRRLKAAERMLESGALEELPRRWDQEWRDEALRRIDDLRDVDLADLDDVALQDHVDRILDLASWGQELHFRLFVPHLIGVHELVTTTEDLLGWDPAKTLQLLQGLSTTSAGPARALRSLADLIREHPAAMEAVEEAGDDLLDRLDDVDSEVAEAVAAYRDRWGLRTLHYDPGAPTLLERPALLARLLRDAVHDAEVGVTGDPDASREDVVRQARDQLTGPDARRRFDEALALAERVYPLREDNVVVLDNMPAALLRLAAREIGRRLTVRGVLGDPEDAVWLHLDELRGALRGEVPEVGFAERIDRRRGERRWVRANPGPPVIGAEESPPPDLRGLPEAARRTNSALLWAMGLELSAPGVQAGDADLVGVPASAGTYTGPARVIRSEDEFDRLRPGDVLVCRITTPAWSVLFAHAGALITDGGGVLSHAAIIAREHGIPAVLGTNDATSQLENGTTVTVDGAAGTVTIDNEEHT